MLIQDAPGTVSTVYVSLGIEELPLLDDCADVVVCRNALDHVPDPAAMLHQIRRILKPDGIVYRSVDIGGSPTPDEPTVFTIDGLTVLVEESLAIVSRTDQPPSTQQGASLLGSHPGAEERRPRAARRQGSGAEQLSGAAEPDR
jgi:SAM-dependent methyltransferase